jgi:hypothetical protein
MSVLNSPLVVVWMVVATILVTWVLPLEKQSLHLYRMLSIALDVLTRWREVLFIGPSTFHTNCSFPYIARADLSYGEVDGIYSRKAYENHNGFTNAQSALNVIEVLMQIWFLNLRKKPGKENLALLVGYTVSVMTFSKTVLYWLQEYFSG